METDLKRLQYTENKIQYLQAGAQWTAKNEQSNRYFLSQYRARRQHITMDKLKHNGVLKEDPSGMANIVHQYYNSLYQSNYPNGSRNNPRLEFPPPIDQTEYNSIITPITLEIVLNTIRILPKRKSLGPDGIPYEIYSKNRIKIAPQLVNLFNHILTLGTPIPDSGMAFVITLFKKGDREDIKNWRPIALTNTDSKIFSKIMASRIGIVAQRIISDSQYGFIPNRFIWDNIHLVNNITESKGNNGALLFLDQEKAYDRVNWSFLKLVLDTVKFPKIFIE